MFLATLSLVLLPFGVDAETDNFNISEPDAIVCEALGRIGMGCIKPQSTPNSAQILKDNSNNKNTDSSLTANIFSSSQKNNKRNSVLVRVIGQEKVYEIINGKKHFIPTKDIFYDYGFKDELIQNITAGELNKYPRLKLIKQEGDKKKTYYLSEGQRIRLVPNKKISKSYGNREEDSVVVSKKEFNFYPQNQFIHLEKPLRWDIFQIVGGKKRYVTPMAVARMNIKIEDVAPVNEMELNYYKISSPIVF